MVLFPRFLPNTRSYIGMRIPITYVLSEIWIAAASIGNSRVLIPPSLPLFLPSFLLFYPSIIQLDRMACQVPSYVAQFQCKPSIGPSNVFLHLVICSYSCIIYIRLLFGYYVASCRHVVIRKRKSIRTYYLGRLYVPTYHFSTPIIMFECVRVYTPREHETTSKNNAKSRKRSRRRLYDDGCGDGDVDLNWRKGWGKKVTVGSALRDSPDGPRALALRKAQNPAMNSKRCLQISCSLRSRETSNTDVSPALLQPRHCLHSRPL